MSRGKETRKKKEVAYDQFIGSKSVAGLAPRNFEDYLTSREVTMVMFYDAEDPQCEWSKKHFLKAAKTTHRINHGYAAVDCIREIDLCAQEGIVTLPSFKLYVGTKAVDTYTKPKTMTYDIFKGFVEKMVVVPDAPPCERPCDKERNSSPCSSRK